MELLHKYQIGDLVRTSTGEIGFIRNVFHINENTPYYYISIVLGNIPDFYIDNIYMENVLTSARLEDLDDRNPAKKLAIFFNESPWLSELAKSCLIDDLFELLKKSAATPTSESE